MHLCHYATCGFCTAQLQLSVEGFECSFAEESDLGEESNQEESFFCFPGIGVVWYPGLGVVVDISTLSNW